MPDNKNQFGQPIGTPVPDWQGRPAPPRTPMEGRYCRLEALSAAKHAAALHDAYAAAPDSSNWTYLPYGPFASLEEYAVWVESMQAGDDPLLFAIAGRPDERPVGVTSYLRINPAQGSIEVGHLNYSPALQRTAAATEAMYLMMRRAFEELGYRRYEWKCDSRNAPSRRAAERLGFRYEGTFRQAMVMKGRNRDTAWFSIVDTEWPRVRAALEAWLDPSNFGEGGRQRQPLQVAHVSAEV
ncbi:MAG: GNAT family N-acetyltransferase [Deltaproteobacteria bacterium]|nr:GNAT family N-acetyltransferase [Deltaproteobacteria bacterium]MBW2402267.1 GNAT family N-acetyltransferase [Deltaproteobacteria bacterium]MBW2719707.1 GNAT family N-acetyltransferase [Deltaproteobacteria bacterium]